MLTFATPALLVAGALAALVPLLLHLIRRRPPSRSALPTVRFLREDARSAVRMSRPTDLLLLALRMLLLLLAGAALARPAWVPAPEGVREVVLLERGAAMRENGAWNRAVGGARRTLLAPDGRARGELILFDTAAVRVPARRVTAALFDSLASAGPSALPASYAAALRALEPVSRELRGADSVRVTMYSALRWGGWRPGTAALRRAAWPGAIRTPETSTVVPTRVPAPGGEASPRALVIGGTGVGRFLVPALAATGWDARAADGLPGMPQHSDVRLVVAAGANGFPAGALREWAEGGGTVLVDAGGARVDMANWLPARGATGRTRGGAGDLSFGGGLRLAGALERTEIQPKRGAILLASWDDGRPAAVAAPLGRGCVVYVATRLEDGDLPVSPSFPRAVQRLAHGCRGVPATGDALPLDEGARAVLRGTGPSAVAASAAGGAAGGVQLGRWVMAGALLVALLETFVAYRRRKAQ